MPRIRTIKPEFWSDEKLAPLPPIDQLVFLGLISLSDDFGRVLDNIKITPVAQATDQPENSLRIPGWLKQGSGKRSSQFRQFVNHQS